MFCVLFRQEYFQRIVKIIWMLSKTINTINWYIKANGRFYIDDYNDIAYSLRLGYELLEVMPDKFLCELEAAIQYYEDLFELIIAVCAGKKTYFECRDFISMRWDEDGL